MKIFDDVTVALCITVILFPWICGDSWTFFRDHVRDMELF